MCSCFSSRARTKKVLFSNVFVLGGRRQEQEQEQEQEQDQEQEQEQDQEQEQKQQQDALVWNYFSTDLCVLLR